MNTTSRFTSVALILTLVLLLGANLLLAAPYEIQFKSGTVTPTAGEFIIPQANLDESVESVHVLLQLEDFLRGGKQARLKSYGVDLLTYLPDRAYIAAIPSDLNASRLAPLGVRAITPVYPEYKLHPRVSESRFGDWSLLDSGERIFAVEIMADIPLDIAAEELEKSGYLIGSHYNAAHTLLVACHEALASLLADFDCVLFVDEAPPPLQELNSTVRTRLHVNEVQAAPYNLSGDGVTILVFDGGMADNTHPDFIGRMTWSETAGISDHATHTSGTVGGSGAASGGTYRGMAPAATLISGQYDECNPYCFYESPGDIEEDYTNCRLNYDIELTTNSMGANVNSNQNDCGWLGDYETTSRLLDGMVRQTVNAPLIMFWSAGNERNDTWCGISTYECISIPAGTKNIITVGATTAADASASFSSWGPTDDGRIKPEIVATGVNVNSCAPGGGYQTMSGTSMSCTAAAGVGCLILEQWHTMHPGAPDMLPETMKALLINSATELGTADGPDYQRGYGIVNAQEAIDQMIAGGILESSLEIDEVFNYTFTVPQGLAELSISLAWSDVPASGNVIPTLVNDLDLVLSSPLDTDHLPWVLNPDSPASAATRAEDHTNVCEQVTVANPTPGEWTLIVTGLLNSGDSQTFAIASSIPLVTEWTTVSGTVASTVTQTGVPGRVSIVGGSQTIWTTADGAYTLSLPLGASYQLRAEAYGLLPETVTINANISTISQDFELDDAEQVTLSGIVSNGQGYVFPGAAISVEFPNSTPPGAITDAAGNYSILLPGSNRYTITANYMGVTTSEIIELPASGTATLNIILGGDRLLPVGPDDYGYYCYELADIDLTPVYEYTSIMPSQGGTGTQVGPGTGNDWIQTVNLPFTMTYYGQDYTQVTIAADGWVAMGSITALDSAYRNVNIGYTGAPNGMICVFWDDLFPYHATEGGEIGYYHDAANGRFIIEYREVPHFNPITNHVTAQLIIYDLETRPTVTGDNEFDLHFARFDYVGPGSDVDQDATIGIESPTGTDGLQIVFDGVYDPRSFPLEVGSALRFTTGLFAGIGSVSGTITTVPPLTDLSMFAIEMGEYSTTANADGSYLIENVASRQYRVTISADGFETVQSELIMVTPDQNTVVDFDDVYRLDPARNLDGEHNSATGLIDLFWDPPLWSVINNLDEFVSYQVYEQGRGLLGNSTDTTYSWQPPNIGYFNFWVKAMYDGGESVNSDTVRILVLDANELVTAIPQEFTLNQNFPNPFNPNTTIRFGLPFDSEVRLEVFDLLGRSVAVLTDSRLSAGYHSVEFNATGLGTGIYFYRLHAGSFEQLRKMMLIR
ncbi:S8 family serine peptidase [bacterium]|nr:S8 family serine peptidase [bacterium]